MASRGEALWLLGKWLTTEDGLMAYTIEQFSQEAHHILAADPGPEGRKKVGELVSRACTIRISWQSTCPMTAPTARSFTRIRNSVSVFSVTSFTARRKACRTTTGRPGRFTARPSARRS